MLPKLKQEGLTFLLYQVLDTQPLLVLTWLGFVFPTELKNEHMWARQWWEKTVSEDGTHMQRLLEGKKD